MARSSITPFRPGSLGGDPFLSLYRDVNRLFDEAFRGGLTGPSGEGPAAQAGGFVNARMNVSETEREFRVTAELPGVTEKDIDVSLDDDLLTIRGEKRMEKKEEQENFHFVERSFGSFQRTLRLPYAVDPDQVQARFDNGVLTVTMPKTAQQERARRIQIQGGARQPEQIEATSTPAGQSTEPSQSTDQSQKAGQPGTSQT
ncbi:Hsp20/alpha crystallin family protein [Sinorhizobium numidicum]|uniref:Hsp20/alpha crystallin family protein n=1 Tax=Sinorhizobium numidicum TaxID=680248 RepID=A0ABY8CSR1_9HYPH|nr:Hsp20/alpha crystallin family protein [Sinorhizobium numidicum]WEX74517.1 Hsp20/alpha crystallin family protein [Sinorhizobium numidicum]WEX80507.1 Hsp20/alpha crystallin family protein [Sinorhizobium numidicum]